MRSCRLCGSPLRLRWDSVGVATMPEQTRDVRECVACGAWWMDAVPGVGDDAYYRSKPEADHLALGTGTGRFRRVRAAIVQALGHEPRSILDVGAARGAHLAVYGRSVHKAAVEPAESARTNLANLGIEWLGPSVDWVTEGRTFEVVTCLDVLEHVQDPREFLHAVDRAVTDDGLLVLVTGDSRPLPSRIARRRWQYVALPEHRAAFRWRSLRPIVEDALRYRLVRRSWIANEEVTIRYLARFGIGLIREAALRVAPEADARRHERADRAWFPFFFDNMLIVLRKAS